MLKRIWLFLLVTLLLLNFSACGKTPAEQQASPPEELVTDPITLIELESLVLRVLKIEPDNAAGYTVSIMTAMCLNASATTEQEIQSLPTIILSSTI